MLWMAPLLVFALLGLSSCTGGRHFELVGEGPSRNVPQYVVVTKAPQVATLHFPTGTYRLYATDDTGSYYRSEQPVFEHVGGGAIPLKGGVYVTRKRPATVRPYVYRAGALTHVGKLKPGTYEFQNEPSIP
jgi:hypothetical protein